MKQIFVINCYLPELYTCYSSLTNYTFDIFLGSFYRTLQIKIAIKNSLPVGTGQRFYEATVHPVPIFISIVFTVHG